MTKRQKALALAAIGVVLALLSVVGYLSNLSNVGPVAAVETSLTDTSPSATTPAFTPTTAAATAATWAVNKTSKLSELEAAHGPTPTRLTIEALAIDAPIGAYGVDRARLMDVPDNVTEVAWYQHGPSPGEPGSAVLAAHVDLRETGPGIFYDLHELSVGDRILVSYSDGSSHEFQVAARTIYLKDALPLDVIFSRSGPPVLTLVTCGGAFNQTSRTYDSNVVVYASSLAPDKPGRR